jgi:uncharacterized protein YtpQ (UPF0354 family)
MARTMSNPDDELSREQFAQRVIELVKARFPLVKIARAEQPFALRINGQVASLENLFRASRLKPDDMKHNIERWAVELLRAAEGSPDQGADFETLSSRILPMILSQQQMDPQSPSMVSQPLVADLHIAYAIDSDRTIAYIPQAQFQAWNVSLEDLHNKAQENLVSRSESIAAHAAPDEQGRVSLILFQTMDGFDASRVLLPTLHERLREYLGSPFAAAIPNRDILLCFRNEAAVIDNLRNQVKTDYLNMPHQVTDKLLLITQDGLAPLD